MSNDIVLPADAPAGESQVQANDPVADQHESHNLDDLETLLAEATAAYSQKHYREAAELYSRATELQAEKNGELSTENAQVLYLYGRCLYHVAVEGSDVLGEKVAGEKAPEKSKDKKTQEPQDTRITKEGIAAIATGQATEDKQDESKAGVSKPYFQFTGDENFDDSGDDEEDNAGEQDDGDNAEEESDDFHNAFEILDLARVLLERHLEELQASSESKTEDSSTAETIKRVKDRLADTHDLQAEISLEGEQFLTAIGDLRAALAIKKDLYPPESSYLAELHFKLSLALEFASVTPARDANGEVDTNQPSTIDKAMRQDAATEMELAISSCKQRIVKEEAALASGAEIFLSGRKEKVTRKSIDEVKGLVADMEQRLVELRQAPVSINDPRGTGALEGSSALNGILGAILGESAQQQTQRLEEANRQAKDITGLVRKKKAAPVEASASMSIDATANATASTTATTATIAISQPQQGTAGTKRKMDHEEDNDSSVPEPLKKARVEDVPEGI